MAIKSYNGELMLKGKEGEQLIKEWLINKSWKEVLNVGSYKENYKREIDLLCTDEKGKKYSFEIKTDKHLKPDGNILCEIFRINHPVSNESDAIFHKSWSFTSVSDIIVFINLSTKYCVISSFEVLRQIIKEYVREKRKKTDIRIVETDNGKTTFNFIIPLEFARIYNIKELKLV